MVYPLSRNGHCIYHLSQNVKLKVSGVNRATCAKKFRECARAYTEGEFLHLYGDFSSRYPSARLYLDDHAKVEKWARCHAQGEKYNIDTSNAVESINGVLEKARRYSLLQMIDAIIDKMGEWSTKYRKESAEIPAGQKLVPFVENELHGTCKEAKKLPVHELNGFRLEYSVMGRDGIKYLVNLRSKTCSSKRFDIDKYPCVHAITAAREAKKEAEPEMQLHDLCLKYYWVELWVLAYSRTIYPVPHRSQWIVPEEIKGLIVLPPDYDVKIGRRQEKRYASIGEHRGKGGKKRSKRKCGMSEWFNNDDDQR
ncbi:hypothetical protein V5N11_022230 [Cardamine amara subsp. amara]|uniref:SWIM-type domain-containing protein n=1 Tax=Cardamine amara subsp. amara TaxID=228776 RepID=A0ABD1BVL1_CARAN